MQPVSFEFAAGSKPAKATSRSVHESDGGDKRQSISTFEAAGNQPDRAKKVRKVIACQPDQLRTAAKKEADAIGKLEDRFETAAKQEQASGVAYGLVQQGTAVSAPSRAAAQPLPTKSRLKGTALDLAEEPTVDAYGDMPVEDFGMALLRGMGMTEENKVETVEYIARPSRMGLGVDPGKIGARRG